MTERVAGEARSGVGSRRRASIGATPSTARGRRTRALLLQGARTVFERDGFLDARVADIAAAAGTGHGSFYTYFDSKADAFRTLVNEVMETGLYAPARPPSPRSGDGRAPTVTEAWRRIEQGNRRYLELFRRDSRLLALFEQVASFDEELRRYRLELRERSVARAAAGIARLQEWGLADADLDPVLASHALNSMVTQYIYYWLVLGQEHTEADSVRTLTHLWARSIGLPPPP
ncbi:MULTISPECIES: TetR/AcrR family transcriptional regulator [Pseudonocardia]|uniref:AcrR family transcriptional regulator n=1 Tax=Pseudonocardia alni TaxID=33907 RepID=A0A852WF45_PSEA5|nr:TetR/AcrR family transcriptional regulator [Pseudonocardia antarctica]NYG04895.1 AcrR family transcriptional regulator [Pseudonocardia antarctica]OJG06993.1 Bacterial regulatory protein, tetR family [Pseudonocardia autotrophica]